MNTQIDSEYYEKASRILCEIRGIDPDEQFAKGLKPESNELEYEPQYKAMADQLRDFDAILRALMLAKQP